MALVIKPDHPTSTDTPECPYHFDQPDLAAAKLPVTEVLTIGCASDSPSVTVPSKGHRMQIYAGAVSAILAIAVCLMVLINTEKQLLAYSSLIVVGLFVTWAVGLRAGVSYVVTLLAVFVLYMVVGIAVTTSLSAVAR